LTTGNVCFSPPTREVALESRHRAAPADGQAITQSPFRASRGLDAMPSHQRRLFCLFDFLK